MEIQSVLRNDRDIFLQFAYNQLSKKQHHDDYAEYLQLAIISLGGTVSNVSFNCLSDQEPRITLDRWRKYFTA